MEMTISIIIGLAAAVIAAVVTYSLSTRNSKAKLQKELDTQKRLIQSELEAQYTKVLTQATSERDNALSQLSEYKESAQKCEKQAAETLAKRLEEQHLYDKEQYDRSLSEKEKAHKDALSQMESHHAESIKNQQERFEQTIKSLSSEIKSSTEEILKSRQEELDKRNTTSMNQLLDPLQKEMEEVKKMMDETKSSNEKSSESLKGALEAMISQTNQLGKDATNLADALKNKGKVHGDWGEHVLEDILAGSGLREGIEFSKQDSYKGEGGNELRPDVVVTCADGKKIIVDSKVSLKDYTDALGAETDEERQNAIKRNYESVKKHVKELATKQYPKYVNNSLNYVLMFVPNEGSYVMAMNHNHGLAQEAFRQGVIIVNPTNLMLTLHLVLQTWQNSRQEENCQQIIASANSMYDKMISVVDSCTLLGNQLETASRTYARMNGQLSEGNGNLMRRMEGLKELGVTSTKTTKVRKQATQEPITIEPKEVVDEKN